jgi:predicted amidohydrolase
MARAVANYPAPVNNGNSQAYTCVAWKDGKPRDTLIANAGEQEEVLVASFDLDEIRAFRIAESWRMERLRQRARKTPCPTDLATWT